MGPERPGVMPEGAPVAVLSAAWDSVWYARIAASGYSTSPDVTKYQDYAFLPLYPSAEWLFANATGLSANPWGYNVAGVLLSHTFFLFALILIHTFAIRLGLSSASATWSIWLLCALPWSFIFSTGYSESLFLLLAAGALFTGYKGLRQFHHKIPGAVAQSALAGLLAGLAAITRAQGLVVALAVLSMLAAGVVLDQPHPATISRAVMAVVRRAQVLILSVGPAILLLLSFVMFIGIRTGNATAAVTIRTAWGSGWTGDLGRLSAGPFVSNGIFLGDWLSFVSLLVWSVLVVRATWFYGRWVRDGLSSYLTGSAGADPAAMPRREGAIRVAVAFGLLIFALGYYVVSLVTNVGNAGWGRYLVVSFPLIWAVSQLISSPFARRCIAYALLGSQALLLAAMVLKHFLP
jgi:hypothetical protein